MIYKQYEREAMQLQQERAESPATYLLTNASCPPDPQEEVNKIMINDWGQKQMPRSYYMGMSSYLPHPNL